MANLHRVCIKFSCATDEEDNAYVTMDEETRQAWLEVDNDTLAALGVESLAAVLEPGTKPYTFRKIWSD